MFWRVLKKDARLLWWLVAITIAVRVAQGFLAFHGGIYPDDGRHIEGILDTFVGYFASAFLIIMAVHQDGLVGAAQDWLVRPIDRRLLLLAKLLFAALLVLVPYFLLKLTTGMFHGFAFGESLEAALVTTVLEAFFLVLPAMMLGATTQNLAQTLGAIIAAFLFAMFAQPVATHFGAALALNQDPFSWQANILQPGIILAGAVAVLWLAYFQRSTLWARIGCGITFAAFLAVYLLPFPALFALQQAVEQNPKAADTIRIAYDASIPPSQFASTDYGITRKGRKPATVPPFALPGSPFSAYKPMASRQLPIKITGLPPNAVVYANYVDLRLVSADGRVLYRTAERYRFLTWLLNEDNGQSFKLHHDGPGLGEKAIHQVFTLPRDILASLKDVPLRVEVDYAITVLDRHSIAVVPVLFPPRTVAGLGVCESRMGRTANRMVEIWCHAASDNAHCFLIQTKDIATGARNPLRDQCQLPDYRPRLLAVTEKLRPATPAVFPGIYESRVDEQDAKRFPVGYEQLSTSQLIIAGYAPQAHVWRHVETPLVRLRDF